MPSTKAARLNREVRSSDLQRNKTKTGNSKISLKLPKSCIGMQKPLLKGTRWSKTMLIQDSQLVEEGGAEATPRDGSELESDHPSASNET